MTRTGTMPLLIKAELHLLPDGTARYRVASGPAWPAVGGQRCLVGGFCSPDPADADGVRPIVATERALGEVVRTLVSQQEWLLGTESLPFGSVDYVRGGTARFF